MIPTYYRLLMSQDEDSQRSARTQLLAALESLSHAMAPLSQGPYFLGMRFGMFDIALVPWCQRFFSVLQEYRGFCLDDNNPSTQRILKWSAQLAFPARAAAPARDP